MIALGLIARTYGLYFMGLRDPSSSGCATASGSSTAYSSAATIILAGLIGGIVIVVDWLAGGAGSLGQGEVALLAATGFVVGVQIFFTSFLLSILGLRRPR